MGIIRQLDDALANKIAAGEVVERPASVVKELVENSIDAGATVIEVDLVEAGLESIRIIDNGSGIQEDDVLTAFSRHATSKIVDERDLFRIKSLGFRGEALPSIASVSHLTIRTSTGDAAGTLLKLEGGIVQQHDKTTSRRGTDISVENLFFNTPARLKYVKTIHTELGTITDVMNRLALSHPEISFRVRHGERTLLQTNGQGDVRHVLASIYGLNVAKMMRYVEASSLDFQLKGFVALPEISRASRNYVSTIVNGRYVKNSMINRAIQDGYHTLLPIGRYPIAHLHMEMDPSLVDVNVHPSKMEVRLSKEQELFALISQTVKDVFRKETLIPSANSPHVKRTREEKKTEQPSFELDHKPMETTKTELSQVTNEEVKSNENIVSESQDVYLPVEKPVVEDIPVVQVNDKKPVVQKERIPPLYPIGQMHGTYIIAQNETGLYLIDQHAAQERIKYEFYRDKIGQVDHEVQELLVPLTFDVSGSEAMALEEHREVLKQFGLNLEDFGHNSYCLRAHPTWFPKGEEVDMVEGILEQVKQTKKIDIAKLREDTAIMMSCKASIKANHHLRNDEIQQLLDTLRESQDPFTCPHGRPIIISFSVYELEKMFKRVM